MLLRQGRGPMIVHEQKRALPGATAGSLLSAEHWTAPEFWSGRGSDLERHIRLRRVTVCHSSRAVHRRFADDSFLAVRGTRRSQMVARRRAAPQLPGPIMN